MSGTLRIILMIALGFGILGVLIYGIMRILSFVAQGYSKVSDLVDDIRKGDAEAQATPRSLSNVDRIVIPQILRRFPEYDNELMVRRAVMDGDSYLKSLLSGVSSFTEKDGVRSFLEMIEETAEKAKNTVNWTDPRVHSAAVSKFEDNGDLCYVTYQVSYQYSVEGYTYQRKLAVKYIAAESPDYEKKIQVYKCPNCGAPVSQIGQKVCRYCGIALKTAAPLSWFIFDITDMS